MNADPDTPRKAWLSLLATAPATEVAGVWANLDIAPAHTVLRRPEVGGVMVRGRAGATGAAFNLGEMTVTRCSVQLAVGPVGHGYVQGRDKTKALQVALIDALMQTDQAAVVDAGILAPLRAGRVARASARAARAAATKVDFFTMARGES